MNNPKFKPQLNTKGKSSLGAQSAPDLIRDPKHRCSQLNAKSETPKVYFMSNCDKCFDRRDVAFVNYLPSGIACDETAEGCLRHVIMEPQCVSHGSSYIRLGSNTDRLLKILRYYISDELVDEFKYNIRESPVEPNYQPLSYKGSFRVFTLYNFEKNVGHVLYVAFFDPYHLVFPSRKGLYQKRKNFIGEELMSIEEKFHSKLLGTHLVRDFNSLKH